MGFRVPLSKQVADKSGGKMLELGTPRPGNASTAWDRHTDADISEEWQSRQGSMHPGAKSLISEGT